MKKIVSLLMLCCLLLCGAAMAENAVPESWKKALEPLQSRLDDGYTIAASAESPDGIRRYFVLTREGRNQLAIVLQGDGVYELELLATCALRQGEEIPVLTTEADYLHVSYENEDIIDDSYSYQYDAKAQKWLLATYNVGTGRNSWRSFVAHDGWMEYCYYESGQRAKERNVYGVYQREVKYLNVDTLPTTLEEARAKLSEPPEIPDGSLTAKNVKFTSGKKYAVYSGPGEDYLRAASGKASVSTNDWIQVFGTEDGWALIQYDISANQMRFGYIDADALPSGADADELAFRPVSAYTTRRAAITDDPLNTQWSLVTLPEGSWVTWLATMGEWAYVESTTGDAMRGFVQLSAITTDRSFSLEDHQWNGAAAALEGSLTVRANGTVTLLVETWRANAAGQQPLRFEAYNEATNELILTAALDEATGCYEGQGTMLNGWSVLICPVYEDGAADTSAALSVQW